MELNPTMRTQITTLFFAFVLIVALLAGCGQSAETTTAETTTTETTTTEMTATEVATEAPAPTAAAEPTEAPAEEPTKEATSTETAVETENGQTTLPDIYTFSLQQPETEAFAKAVERLDLIEKLQSEGPFTAFIPSTNAFARLPESLLAEAQSLARQLGEGPTFAHAVTKRCLHQEWAMGVDEAIEAEAQAQAICMQTQDFERAYLAFVAKERPVFQGD